ncbi:MAG: tol-pal system protein YbgF [Gammaproteobacteria bacterium TMED260]|nr:tol-pal system protein YbgF [Gammaproteobacteria bacterium]OUX33509.1 MAG: tol-pal system protein YbgF [Gammaproteobacteria bacterium TMED260]
MTKFPDVAARNILIGSLVLVAAPFAAAQGVGAVIESQPSIPGQSIPSQTVAGSQNGASNDALSLLLDQNRQLQAEIQALRGMVEEQGFEIRKLQRDSLSRYTDMDDRLRSLETSAAQPSMPIGASTSPGIVGQSSAPGTGADAMPTIGGLRDPGSADAPITGSATTAPTVPLTAADTASSRSSRVTSRGTLQPAVLSEQQLYQMAYDSVINSNFERSIAEFDQYLSIYPQGRFVTNAHYWKGQAYLYLNRYDEARDSYEIILEQFQESAKLPDAMYGLGLAYQGLGNIPQARQLLNEIKRRFPNTGVANLADTRLLTLD